MGAYGAKVGRKYSDLEHRDYQECITGDKQKKRAIFLLFFAVPISSADDVFYHPPHLFRIVHILKRAEAIAAQRKKLFLEGKLDSTFLDNHQEQGQRCNAKEKERDFLRFQSPVPTTSSPTHPIYFKLFTF